MDEVSTLNIVMGGIAFYIISLAGFGWWMHNRGYNKGKSGNVSLQFYDAVMDALRGRDMIEYRELVEIVNARSDEWDEDETEATIDKMVDEGILTLYQSTSDIKFHGKPVSQELMIGLATA